MEEKEAPLIFYGIQTEYGWLRNFFSSPFTEGKYSYATNEHYFQSKKFEGSPKEEYIAQAPTPQGSFDRGNQRTEPLRADWQDVKEQVMRNGLKLKFSQNKELLEKLLATGSRELIEFHEKDAYWGNGGDGSGKNRLGVLLMEVRQELRKKND